jgi:hypothetical protein
MGVDVLYAEFEGGMSYPHRASSSSQVTEDQLWCVLDPTCVGSDSAVSNFAHHRGFA